MWGKPLTIRRRPIRVAPRGRLPKIFQIRQQRPQLIRPPLRMQHSDRAPVFLEPFRDRFVIRVFAHVTKPIVRVVRSSHAVFITRHVDVRPVRQFFLLQPSLDVLRGE